MPGFCMEKKYYNPGSFRTLIKAVVEWSKYWNILHRCRYCHFLELSTKGLLCKQEVYSPAIMLLLLTHELALALYRTLTEYKGGDLASSGSELTIVEEWNDQPVS